MGTYAVAVICVIAVSSVFMFLIFSRMKLLNFRILLSVTLASLISAVMLPCIFNAVTSSINTASEFKTLLVVMIISVAIYILLVLILSVAISHIFTGKTEKQGITESNSAEAVPSGSDPKWMSAIAAAESAVQEETSIPKEQAVFEKEEAAVLKSSNYLEQIYDDIVHDKGTESANNVEYPHKDGNNLEKSVDSTRITDKMGIENNVQESENLTTAECIGEAFRLKEQGDGEGAILYYMYALDKKPQKELTFWIVLDICVIYKTLGQKELAYDVLNSYHNAFGDIMDDSVRKEIEYNLSCV